MPFCTREHRELYRLLHDREPEPAPVKVRSVSTLGGNDNSSGPLPPRSSSRAHDGAKPFADGNCQFCGKTLPIFARLRGVRFCSSDHEANFHQRQTQETLERLAAGQRKQVSPGSVRIRQRAKPQSAPTVLHQPPAAPSALVWQKVDLSRKSATPEVHIPVQTSSPVLPAARQECLPTSPGIWPTLPDGLTPAFWTNPCVPAALPAPSAIQVQPSRLTQRKQIQIPPPGAVTHQPVAVDDRATFQTESHGIRQLTARPYTLEFKSLRPDHKAGFQRWTLTTVPAPPLSPFVSGWSDQGLAPCIVTTAQPHSLDTANPAKSSAPFLSSLVPAAHIALSGEHRAAPAWTAPVSAASERHLPATALPYTVGHPVRPTTLPVALQAATISTAFVARPCVWNSSEIAPQVPLLPSVPLPRSGKPTLSSYLDCVRPWSSPQRIEIAATWSPFISTGPFSTPAPAAKSARTTLAAITSPAPQVLPGIRTAPPVPFHSNWLQWSIAPLAAATSRLTPSAPRPNRAEACAVRLNLLQTEPLRRARTPLQRLRLPAIGSGFTAVIA